MPTEPGKGATVLADLVMLGGEHPYVLIAATAAMAAAIVWWDTR